MSTTWSRSIVKPSRLASASKASYAPVSQSIRVPYTSNVTHLMSLGSGMGSGHYAVAVQLGAVRSVWRAVLGSRPPNGPAGVPGQAAVRPPRRARARGQGGDQRRGGRRGRRGDRLPVRGQGAG